MEPCTRDAIQGSMWKPTPCPPSRYTLTVWHKTNCRAGGFSKDLFISQECISLHTHF